MRNRFQWINVVKEKRKLPVIVIAGQHRKDVVTHAASYRELLTASHNLSHKSVPRAAVREPSGNVWGDQARLDQPSRPHHADALSRNRTSFLEAHCYSFVLSVTRQ